MKLLNKIDDLFCLRVYEQGGHYLKLPQYLYRLRCVLPDVTGILSRMQTIYLKSVQLVGEIITCVAFLWVLQIASYFTCVGSFALLFMFSHIGYTYLGVETIANTI